MKSKVTLFLTLALYSGSLLAQNKVVSIDFSTSTGQPKKLLSVNVGPDKSIKGYQDCGINQIRMHDYYGPCDYWTYAKNSLDIDNQTINPSFNPRIAESYTWGNTDNKVDSVVNSGFIPFFRLGISWPNSENVPKYPPIDNSLNTFSIFASICKHTVMHYTAGWDNGRNYSIPYWEVWNEPDLAEKFWLGTHATPVNYFRMYRDVADSIKTYNPQLKVGGPGVTYATMFLGNQKFREAFIAYCNTNSLPLDFYSWHLYDVRNPYSIKAYGDTIRTILDKNGFHNAESIITEIHPDLKGNEYNDTPKGAAWLVSAFITCNFSEVDNFFWYRGTLLGPLVNADKNNRPDLKWNGLGYKAYKSFLGSTHNLIRHDGDEFVEKDFTADVNSFLTIAGKSINSDTVSVLVSNLKSDYTSIEVKIQSIPWTGNTIIEQYSVRPPNDRFALHTTSTDVSSGNLTHIINNASDPSAFLLKIYKQNNTGLGQQDSVKSQLSVFPNPASTLLMINPANTKSSAISIKNHLGQEVIRIQNFNGNHVDISQLTSGVYFVSDGRSTIKFIKK